MQVIYIKKEIQTFLMFYYSEKTMQIMSFLRIAKECFY